MLRVFFKHNREMKNKLCELAYESIQIYLRKALGKESGQVGMIIALQSFGEYLNSHPHIHAITADGLFIDNGLFYVMPKISIKWLESIFGTKVTAMLIREGKLEKELVRKRLKWRHSGFNIDHGQPVKIKDTVGLERLAQYIIRNPFSEQKMIYQKEQQQVIYHGKYNQRIKRNFEVFTAGKFIAAITQHIPEKGMQLVRYYGWYSNKSRGLRAKRAEKKVSELSRENIINVSDYNPPRVPNRQWQALIQKIWEVDPLECPSCGGLMKIISFIEKAEVIEKILGCSEEKASQENTITTRGSPQDDNNDLSYEPFYDDQPYYQSE